MIIQPGVTSGAGYTFNATGGLVTFTGLVPPNLESILTVTNVTTGTLLYQPQAGASFVGTWASPVLDVAASTAGMSNTDRLLILFEDGNPASAGTPPVADLRNEDLVEMLMRIVKLLESNAVVDSAQRQRITLDAITSALTLATVTTVGTVSTVTTLPTLANVTTLSNMVANAGMDREQYINVAKNAYGNTIRNQLTFQ